MKQPFAQDDVFLDTIRATANLQDDQLRLWWLGQSGFLVQHRGSHALIDPYLSDSLTAKYATTDKPHVRMTARVVTPERLDFIDVVTSSHNHTDHLDGETLRPLLEANPDLRLVIPEANREFVRNRLQCNLDFPIGLDAGQWVEAAGFRIRAVRAAHEELARDDQGRHNFLGYVLNAGPWTVYHSGDTVLFDGMVVELAPLGIHLALLPINGKRPERRVAGNLRGREAAQLAKDIGASLVVPCHYDMFEFNTESPDEFASHCNALCQPFQILENGQGLTYPTPVEGQV